MLDWAHADFLDRWLDREIVMQPTAIDPAVIVLAPPGAQPEVEQFMFEVRAAFAAGSRTLLIDLEQLETLSSEAVGGLITALRYARNHEGSASLIASQPKVLQTLSVTALDRVFPLVERPVFEAPPAPAEASLLNSLTRRAIAGAVVLLLGLQLMAGSAGATSGQTPASGQAQLGSEQIIANVAEQNPNLRSFQSSMHVDVKLTSFPFIRQHLDGTAYFKRPDNYEVVFNKVPPYAKGFQHVYADIGDPSQWSGHFYITTEGESLVAGHRDLALRMVQRVRGMIDHEVVYIDPAAWHIDRMEWHYYNGGVISMDQQFSDVGEFHVLASQHASIHIPFVRAEATANYADYQPNVSIDDGVFTKQHHE